MARKLVKADLAGSEIFNALELSDQERLLYLFKPRVFNKDEIIFLKGDTGIGLYIIHTGRVKICAIDREGAELIFTFLSKGDLLGDLAILDGRPRSATAIAVENTDTFYLDRGQFLGFLNTSPQACIGIIIMLCQRLRRLSTQMEEVSFLDVSGRIARNLIQMTTSSPQSTSIYEHPASCSISQEELAGIVGASRVMVNKVLNSFVDLGLISIGRRRITVVNMVELHRIASYDRES